MTPVRTHIDGVDISHHQGGHLDFQAAKRAGTKFVYHKATEGDSYTDPNYSRRRAEVRAAGLPFGAYHFARPELGDAVAEARRFLDVAGVKPGDLLPCLDLETTEGLTMVQIKEWALNFCKEVKKQIGSWPVVYTPYDLDLPREIILWRPRYNNSFNPPELRWDIWQFSNGVYGNPRTVPGLGHVDINMFRDGLSVEAIRYRKRPLTTPAPTSSQRLRVGHISMQFSDKASQMQEDAVKLFKRAQKRGYRWLTGTEAGGDTLRRILREVAETYGYRFHVSGDTWIAVQHEAITKGSWKQGHVPVLKSSDGEGKHTKKDLTWVSYEDELFGPVSIGCAHYLTKGRPVKDDTYSVNLEWNKKLAEAIAKWGAEAGKGRALSFYHGDQNIPDNKFDTFLGAGVFETIQDELGKYENTGHGPIDVIASNEKDRRVTGKVVRVYNDKEFFLHSDHFLVEGEFDVKVSA